MLTWLVELIKALFKKKPMPIPPTPEPVPVDPPELVQPTPLPPKIDPDLPRQELLKVTKNFLNKDASPRDIAPDTLGCAESVSNIIKTAFGDMKIHTSTIALKSALIANSKFRAILGGYLPGDVIISPTGSGNGKLKNGHAGIFVADGRIASNDSDTGLFQDNYSLDAWVSRYRTLGGFKIYIFRRVEL